MYAVTQEGKWENEIMILRDDVRKTVEEQSGSGCLIISVSCAWTKREQCFRRIRSGVWRVQLGVL